MHLISVA